mmetsp:Transcript_6185/g.14889  ORF Transcript_6185/g.14889 Transcript_6185/m.14889 type:complete len:144 (+) Transcript_6185:82-513(+)
MDIRVPEELQPILRDFTKAVLRDRPDDVLEYSKAYFVSKWEEQRMASYILEPSESEQYNSMPEPLKLATATTFKRFDIDCDGQLTIDELHMMVTETANAFGLDADVADTVELMNQLDTDQNETISWQEWSHGCAVWLHDMGQA